MKKTIKIITLSMAISLGMASCGSESTPNTDESMSAEMSEGQQLFEKNCTSCHRTTPPETKADRKAMLAPPIKGVMFHVNDGIKADNPTDKKAKVIAFITDYARNPSADKSFCEKHAIERFGVMPTQKDNVTAEEVEKIATYLFDTYGEQDIDHDELQKQMHEE